MQIVRSSNYLATLEDILDFIALDSLDKALLFLDQLDEKIEKLSFMPRKYRKSLYHKSADVRDMVFKGYTVCYFVDDFQEKIVILEIFKWKNR